MASTRMVFSFFKKPPEKMVARPAAVPRSTKPGEVVPVPVSGAVALASAAESAPPAASVPPPVTVKATSPATAAAAQAAPADSSDFVFSESSPDFQIEGEIDPVDALAEEAAVLFANGQDDAARSVLENAVAGHRSAPAERLWLMLFDLYVLGGRRAPFDTLGIDYAQAFEKSPPGWRDKTSAALKPAEAAGAAILFKGELCADNEAAFAELQRALAKYPGLRIDLTKVSRLDADGCARLLELLLQARKARRAVDLLGCEALAAKLAARIEGGRAQEEGCWLLYLELCQLLGRCEVFEEAAINYAVTFEVSPPSWEPRAAPDAASDRGRAAPASSAEDAASEAYTLRGEIKAARFGDLIARAEAHDPLLIDCAQLTRIDFISAGALLNVLTTIRRSGKQIVFRHPHHLVAELFAIVGLNAVATVVAEKH